MANWKAFMFLGDGDFTMKSTVDGQRSLLLSSEKSTQPALHYASNFCQALPTSVTACV